MLSQQQRARGDSFSPAGPKIPPTEMADRFGRAERNQSAVVGQARVRGLKWAKMKRKLEKTRFHQVSNEADTPEATA